MTGSDTKSYTLLRNADINDVSKRAGETVPLTADEAEPFLAVGVIVETPVAAAADAVDPVDAPAEEVSLFSQTQEDFNTD